MCKASVVQIGFAPSTILRMRGSTWEFPWMSSMGEKNSPLMIYNYTKSGIKNRSSAKMRPYFRQQKIGYKHVLLSLNTKFYHSIGKNVVGSHTHK